MKKHISYTLIALISGSLIFTSCDNASKPKTESHDHNHEHGDHDHDHGTTDRNTYVMKLTAASEEIQAGRPVTLKLTPQIKGKEDAAVPLDVVHDKKIHLIVVSEDLGYFDHIHPEYQADGSYQVTAQFPAGGNYLLYADYQPSGATPQLEKINVKVSGTPAARATFSTAKTEALADGYTVTLSAGGDLATGSQAHITAIVKQNGKEIPAAQLEDYLGAKAHMVIIGVKNQAYLHVHPEVTDNRLDLHTTFSEPGIYRGWLQFQAQGKVHTADFVLSVAQGKPGAASEDHSHHGHSHAE